MSDDTREPSGKTEPEEKAAEAGKPGGNEAAPRRIPGHKLRPLLEEVAGQQPRFALDALHSDPVEAYWIPPPLKKEGFAQEYVHLRGFLLQSGYLVVGFRVQESLAYTLGGKTRELVFTVRPCRNPYEAAIVWTELNLYRGYFALLEQAEKKAADGPRIILPP